MHEEGRDPRSICQQKGREQDPQAVQVEHGRRKLPVCHQRRIHLLRRLGHHFQRGQEGNGVFQRREMERQTALKIIQRHDSRRANRLPHGSRATHL